LLELPLEHRLLLLGQARGGFGHAHADRARIECHAQRAQP
jgi:hypothetical protein